MRYTTVTFCLAVIFITTGICSQTKAQTRYGDSYISFMLLPSLRAAAEDAFFATYESRQTAIAEANFWQSMSRFNPDGPVISAYFNTSADYQLQALYKTYDVWTTLEAGGSPSGQLGLAIEARNLMQSAGLYAVVGSMIAPGNYAENPVYWKTKDAFDKVELLVRNLEFAISQSEK